MQFLKQGFVCTGLTLAVSLMSALSASAQSLSSYTEVGAGNLTDNGIPIYRFDSQGNNTGAALTASGSGSWTGLDSHNVQQTMTFSGTASGKAEYGRLHASAQGTITNPYYNVSNAPYYTGGDSPDPNGSAQYLIADAHTQFNDALHLNSFSDNGVKIRYVFHLDGNISQGHAYAYINFNIFNASENNFLEFTTDPSTDFATPSYKVNDSSQPIPFSTELVSVIGGNTNDSGTPEGVDGVGLADFYNTLTLDSIQLLDASDNQINGVSYYTDSGTHYNLLGGNYSAVPAPSSFAIFAASGLIGAARILKYRRTRK